MSGLPLAQKLEDALLHLGILEGPLFVLEIGGRKPAHNINRGREPFYALQHKQISLFDADQAEAQRLRDYYGPESNISIMPWAVAKENGSRDLYVTKNRGSSSLYRPNESFFRRFANFDELTVDSVVSVDARSLDWIGAEENWPRVDFLKMDIQGAELEVIEGGQRTLSSVLGIVTEVSFARMYEGQPSFAELHLAIEKLGLEFHHRIGVGTRPTVDGVPGQQQELWGDVLYLRNLSDLGRSELGRIALIAALYSCHHIVVNALRCIGDKKCDVLASNYQNDVVRLDKRQNNRARKMLQVLRHGHTWT